MTASAVVAAVQAYAKINAAGEWIDRTESVSLNDLFDKMSTQELEVYAQSGALPGVVSGDGGQCKVDTETRFDSYEAGFSISAEPCSCQPRIQFLGLPLKTLRVVRIVSIPRADPAIRPNRPNSASSLCLR